MHSVQRVLHMMCGLYELYSMERIVRIVHAAQYVQLVIARGFVELFVFLNIYIVNTWIFN